jgi:hypothetical protein
MGYVSNTRQQASASLKGVIKGRYVSHYTLVGGYPALSYYHGSFLALLSRSLFAGLQFTVACGNTLRVCNEMCVISLMEASRAPLSTLRTSSRTPAARL